MHIVWVKDGRQGHEKQTQAVLASLSTTVKCSITEYQTQQSSWWGYLELFLFNIFGFSGFSTTKSVAQQCENQDVDIIIGAGQAAYPVMLLIKKMLTANNLRLNKKEKKQAALVAILSPEFYKSQFDIICVPDHLKQKYSKIEKSLVKTNILYFLGALAKSTSQPISQNIAMLTIGGLCKRYKLDAMVLKEKIKNILEHYPEKKWYLFTSKRTPEILVTAAKEMQSNYKNIIFSNNMYDEIIHVAAMKIVTADSVSMIYECLSTPGATYLLDLPHRRYDTIIESTNALVQTRKIGYIAYDELAGKLCFEDQKKPIQPLQQSDDIAKAILDTIYDFKTV